MYKFYIWGSCVTRDAFEFANNISIISYLSRSSILSSCSQQIPRERLINLEIKKDISNFVSRIIEDDIYKRSIKRLNNIKNESSGAILVIDLTEERNPIIGTDDEYFFTLSDEAKRYTNIIKLFPKRITQFSKEYIDLLKRKLPFFANEISNSLLNTDKENTSKRIVIHRAFYAETKQLYIKYNCYLEELYDILSKYLPQSISIEVPKELRVCGPLHKWGLSGLHFCDDYYKYFIYQLSKKLDLNIKINNSFSLQNINNSIFFNDSTQYYNYIKDIYGNELSESYISSIKYRYIIERELIKKLIN